MLDLSIVTVVKNDDERLQQTISSIDEQLKADMFDYEHIIVKSDDNQPFGSFQCSHKQSRMHYTQRTYHLNDTGIYMAMNHGIALSESKYLLYLNAGDLLYAQDSIQLLSYYLNQYNDIQLFHGLIYYSNTNIKHSNYDLIGFKNLRDSFKSGALICQQSLIYRRKMLIDLGGFDEKFKYAGDYEIVCRILSANCIVRSIPIVISEYPAGGLSESKSQECAQEINRARTFYSNLLSI